MKKIEFLILLIVAGAVVYLNLGLKDWVGGRNETVDQVIASGDAVSKEEGSKNVFASAGELVDEIVKPDSVNVLLLGLDKSKVLADINIVAHLDTDTNRVKLISIPRDLFIDFREDGFDDVKKGSKITINYCKLTEVYSNAGRSKAGQKAMKEVAEVITGLDIDYVASVDTGGFSDIIDAIGGVDFYVPQDMDYEDPYQDLYIHLKEGQQVLDGEKAEQLVRFRKYTGDIPPDIHRMMVQQDFLKALSGQLLSTRNLKQITELITVAYDMVKTDMDLIAMIRYAEYVLGEGVTELMGSSDMVIIPSTSERIQVGEFNPWFEVWDRHEALLVVEKLMEEPAVVEE